MSQPGSSSKSAVSTRNFYGGGFKIPFEDKIGKHDHIQREKLPYRLNCLFGPTQDRKVFKKQSEALEYAKSKRSGVMTFAFQRWDGTRAFLVSHPKIFWHYDVQKISSQRCTYEIIPDSCACKLYFDLEFEIEFNPGKKGCLIVDTFIFIILHFLSLLFNVKATRDDILNLDSTTDVKFSRHLIFILRAHVFSDNRSVGEFVSFISKKIELYLTTTGNTNCTSQDNTHCYNECKCCKISCHSGCIKDIGLSRENIEHLIVFDRKGNKKLICDCGVYSKNRHFRLYQNTKWGKNAPLILSEDNLYSPKFHPGEKVTEALRAETFFMDSLISNTDNQNVCDIEVLFFKDPFKQIDKPHNLILNLPAAQSAHLDKDMSESFTISHYPAIDKFINLLVFPGQIRKSVYFSSSNIIVYDIIDYRYCQNIGRQHQSNNVKYIVNLNDFLYYQKCYDPECSTFRSAHIRLPPEIKFQLEDNNVEQNESNSLSDTELAEAANVIEDLLNDQVLS